MLDYDDIKVVEDVVNDNMGSGKMFTAYDVSISVISKLISSGKYNKDVHKHSLIKSVIHNVVSDLAPLYFYKKTLHVVGQNGEKAFVYHHTNSDVNTFVPKVGKTKIASTTSVSSQSVSSISSQSTTNVCSNSASCSSSSGCSDGCKKQDSRGTLCIPATLLREVGIYAGNTAYVVNDGGSMVVSKNVPNKVAEYTVDSYNNVRVTKSVLDKFFSNTPSGFKFTKCTSGVVVSAV